MAVAFDAVGPSSSGTIGGGATPLTWAHNPAAGAALAVGVVMDQATSTSTVSCTFGGVSMTLLGSINVNGDNDGFLYVYGLANVTGGSQTVSFSFSPLVDIIAAGSISFTGAGTTGATAFGTFQHNTNSNANPTLGFTTTASTNLIAAFLASGQTTITGPTGGTSRFLSENGSSGDCGSIDGATAVATGGTVTLTYTVAAGSWGLGGVEILAAPSVAITTTSLPFTPAGYAYSATLSAIGGTSPYTWAVSSGSLPSWASLNMSSGVISGTPTSAQLGTTSFTVQATDSASHTSAGQPLALTVIPEQAMETAQPGVPAPGLFSPGKLLTPAQNYTLSLSGNLSTVSNVPRVIKKFLPARNIFRQLF